MLLSHIPSSYPYRFESDFCISFAVTSRLMFWCLSAMNVFWRFATFLWSALRPVRMWSGRPCKRGKQQSALIKTKLASELTPPPRLRPPPKKKSVKRNVGKTKNIDFMARKGNSSFHIVRFTGKVTIIEKKIKSMLHLQCFLTYLLPI